MGSLSDGPLTFQPQCAHIELHMHPDSCGGSTPTSSLPMSWCLTSSRPRTSMAAATTCIRWLAVVQAGNLLQQRGSVMDSICQNHSHRAGQLADHSHLTCMLQLGNLQKASEARSNHFATVVQPTTCW
jgi:hypothetical protein